MITQIIVFPAQIRCYVDKYLWILYFGSFIKIPWFIKISFINRLDIMIYWNYWIYCNFRDGRVIISCYLFLAWQLLDIGVWVNVFREQWLSSCGPIRFPWVSKNMDNWTFFAFSESFHFYCSYTFCFFLEDCKLHFLIKLSFLSEIKFNFLGKYVHKTAVIEFNFSEDSWLK